MDSVGNSKNRPSIMPDELSDMLSNLPRKRFTVTEAGGKYQVENNVTGEVVASCEREQWAKAIANNFNVLIKMKGKANA